MVHKKSIPAELLLLIAEYLTIEEKMAWRLVCKDWNQAFQHSIYHSVHITNTHQLLLFIMSLNKHQKSSTPIGHLVHQIHIADNKFSIHYIRNGRTPYGLTNFHATILQQLSDLCPNLKVLDITGIDWDVYVYEGILKWKYIRQFPTLSNLSTAYPYLKQIGHNLTTFSIQTSTFLTGFSLTDILSMVPNVTKLVIEGCERGVVRLTLNDIEAIHRQLPLLQTLEITGNDITMEGDLDNETLQKITDFPTVANLKTFYLDTHRASVMWVAYVTHKYPHLEHLKLNVYYEHATSGVRPINLDPVVLYAVLMMDKNRPFFTEKILFLNLAARCKFLKTISLSCPILSHWLNRMFFGTLGKVNPGIQQVNPLLKRESQFKFESDFGTAVEYGGHLIRALEIRSWVLFDTFSFIIHSLSEFTQLTYLEIENNRQEIMISVVLDSSPLLDTLILLRGIASISSSNTPRDFLLLQQQQHPLKTLKLEDISFKNSIFPYLSTRCPSLKNLHITACQHICELSEAMSQEKVEISMPNNHFENVIIDKLQLDCSLISKLFSHAPFYIKIASIKTPKGTDWYHHTGYSQHTPSQRMIEVLSVYEARAIRAYLNAQQSITIAWKMLDPSNSQKLGGLLRKHLMSGYVLIECKGIKNFLLDGG